MLSKGQQLFHDIGIKQAVCIPAACFEDEIRLRWTDSFSKNNIRHQLSKVPSTAMLLVISQNCDIAAYKDENESSIELIVCKKIKARDLYPGKQFAYSCRRLQFQCDDNWYEANVDYLLTVEKGDLVECIKKSNNFQIITLSPEHELTIPVWRANRYLRTGLPDSFNERFIPVLNDHLANIEEVSLSDDRMKSVIKALYIGVDPNAESETHAFKIFALLRQSVSDAQLVAVSDAIEDFAVDLNAKAGFVDLSNVYADRENNTFVSFLNGLLRLNLDYVSLAKGDGDL
ncbi:hypothetical protein [Atlantibacter hermannii]|uniref:hypothetical protein n=1 Tax=Atlantibacter hermannii TaxID=565 RepID=UPI0022B7D501|nr:hypothetical protein [Atlantibacter hermannii]MCZ7836159.1 hypothetical protein [Atlantibacter hermannii]